MAVNEFLRELTNTGRQVRGYANNIVLICRGKYEEIPYSREFKPHCASLAIQATANIVLFTVKRKPIC